MYSPSKVHQVNIDSHLSSKSSNIFYLEKVPNYIINNIEIKTENVAQDSHSKNQENEDRSDQNRLDTVKISSKQTKNDDTSRIWVTMGMNNDEQIILNFCDL